MHRPRPEGPFITARPQALLHARPPSESLGSAIPKLPPLAGSKAHQQIESKKQLELDRALRELVYASQVTVDVGATVFYFVTRKGKLRRLELTEPMAKRLENGELAVVERPDPGMIDHALVPAEVAEKMLALLPKSVRFFNRPNAPVGFLSDDEIKTRQDTETAEDVPAGTEGTPEVAAVAAETPAPEAPAPEAPVPESPPPSGAAGEPTGP